MTSNSPFTFYLDWKVGAQFAGLFSAHANGLYEEAGLKVDLVPWLEDARSIHEKVVREAGRGELCAGCAEDNLIVRQAARDGSVLAFGAMLQEPPLVLMSRPERGIRNIGDLRGKRVGMHPDGIRALEIILALEGIRLSELTIHEVGFDLEHLRQDRFDALQGYTMTEPVQLARLGLKVATLPIEHPRLKPYAQVYFSERHLLRNRPAELAAFLAASNAGWLSVCADPDSAARLIAEMMGTPTKAAEQREMLERVIPLVTGGRPIEQIGTIEPTQWRRNLDTYTEFGLVDRPVDFDEIVFDIQLG